MERDPRAVVRPVSKGRFRTLPVCIIKSRKFESKYSGNATETSTWVDFISPYGQHSLCIYNKVYSPAMGVLSLRIYRKTESVCVKVNVIVKVLGIRAVVS